ncbi:hypothetical protein BaRGS_00038263 [Batillaria attramentaria]|uniref:Ankyrin-3 n=1 Tax=Batillaria attramentaria TaxID=370345 RepID=A0ABD0J6K6_9CAEN
MREIIGHEQMSTYSQAYISAANILEKDRCLIISGSGWTEMMSLGHSLLVQYSAKGYTPLIAHRFEEWQQVSRKGTKQIVFLKDIFGRDKLNEGQIMKWIMDFEHSHKSFTRDGCLVIITVSVQVMNQLSAFGQGRIFEGMRRLDLDKIHTGSGKPTGQTQKSRHSSDTSRPLYNPDGADNTPLHNACHSGDLDIVKRLVDEGASLSTLNKAGQTPLRVAFSQGNFPVICFLLGLTESELCQYAPDKLNLDLSFLHAVSVGHKVLVERFLCQGADPESRNEAGESALHIACRHNRADIAETLIKHTKNVDPVDREGQTPLHAASSAGYVEPSRLLLQHNANIESFDAEGYKPLHIASKRNHLSVIKLFLQYGANVETQTQTSRQTALHVASAEGQTNACKLLLENDAMVNAVDTLECTPLHFACERGYPETVKVLLTSSADANAVNKDGFSPLHIASMKNQDQIIDILLQHGAEIDLTDLSGKGHVSIVEMLLNRGADAEKVTLNGFTPLHLACQNGHTRVVEILLNSSVDVDKATSKGATPLHLASKNGHVTIVEMLLNRGADAEKVTLDGATPLHFACQNGHTRVVEILLNSKANVDKAMSKGATSLHLASGKGYVTIVEMLLNHGADAEKVKMNGFTSLHFACQNGHTQVVEILLKHNDDTGKPTSDGDTPLHLASLNGHVTIVEMLLNRGADAEKVKLDGFTPLHLACQNGHTRVVEILLNSSADVDMATSKGATSLHLASLQGHVTIVEMLLNRGADAEKVTLDGFTPLHLACQNGHTRVVEILLNSSVDVDKATSKGATPLHLASLNGHVTIVEMLLNRGADAEKVTLVGATPLHVACQNGHTQVVEILLKQNDDIDKATSTGATPLHLASENGHVTIVEMLLNRGADAEKVTLDGATPLHLACQNGHTRVVEILLNSSVDVDKATSKGTTSLHLASLQGHVTIVEMLLNRGADAEKVTLDGATSLHFACQNGHTQVAEILLTEGADKDKVTATGCTPLFFACFTGRTDVAELLFKHGAEIEIVNENNQTPLHIASQYGNFETVVFLLEKGAKNDRKDVEGCTPLHLSSFFGHNSIVLALLEYNSEVDAKEQLGYTPLHFACFNGHGEVANTLLNHGADKSIKTHNNFTCLEIACKNGHMQVVERLTGVNEDRERYLNENTLLHLACGNDYFVVETAPYRGACVGNHEAVVRYLLGQKEDINATNQHGDTPLHCASAAGRAELVKLLIQHGADIQLSCNDGNTPLHLACSNGHCEGAALLLEAGAKPDKVNDDGNTPLHSACTKGHVRVVSLLLERGSDPNAVNNKGNTPLHEASYHGFLDIVQCLLCNNASAIVANNEGEVPADLASKEHHEDVARLLQPYGGPSFCKHWHFKKTFFRNGGRLQGKHSDVVLTIPENAIKVSDTVIVKGAVSMDLRRAHEALGLPENENLISPIVEYSSGQGYEFQSPVQICIPHFLPKTFCRDKVRVYKFKRNDSGGFIPEELTLLQPGDADEARSKVFQISEHRPIKVWISHFCAVVCTYCGKIPPQLTLKLYGNLIQRDRKDVELSLYIWDKRLTCQDSCRVFRLSDLLPCCPETIAKTVHWALHNAPDTDPEVFRCVIKAGYVSADNGPSEIMEGLPQETLMVTLDTVDSAGEKEQRLTRTRSESTLRLLENRPVGEQLKTPVQATQLKDSDVSRPLENQISTGENSGAAAASGPSEFPFVNPDDIEVIKVSTESDPEMIARFEKMASGEDTEIYRMRHCPRGVLLIINNRHFDRARSKRPGFSDRDGTEVDGKALHNLFTGLGFKVESRNDCTSREMEIAVQEEMGKDHTAYDCFACAILSHGSEDVIFGVDGSELTTERLKDIVNASGSLNSKPKLIFIQACQGAQHDAGKAANPSGEGAASSACANSNEKDRVDNNASQGSKEDPVQNPPTLLQSDCPRVPSTSDLFICVPSSSGYYSYRDPQRGTLFIQAIVKVFAESACKKDFCSLMSKVGGLISKYERHKQQPGFEFYPRKELYFFPGLPYASD